MTPDYIKLATVASGLLLLFQFATNKGRHHLLGVALFFTSIAVFSQNFYFIFRELHQGIQLVIILLTLPRLSLSLKSFNIVFLIFGAFILLSYLQNPFDEDGRAQTLNFVVLLFVVNYLYLSIKSTSDLSIIFRFIGRLAISISLVGLLEYAINRTGRIETSFANPNYLGLFLGVGFCFIQNGKSRIEKRLGSFLVIVAIFLTGSRSSFAIPIFYFLWQAYSRYGIRKALLYSIGSIALVLLVFISGLTRLSDTEAAQASDAERFIFARIAISMALDHPYTGVGWGRFISEFENYSSTVDRVILDSGVIDASKQDRRVTHNDLLRILSELGFLAFFTALIFVFKNLTLLFKFKGSAINCLPPIWLGFLLFSMTHNNLNTAYTWFFLILPLVALKRKWIL